MVNETKILKKHETPMCQFTNFTEGGKEYWHCLFKSDSHPVNKKLFKMSGAEQNEKY